MDIKISGGDGSSFTAWVAIAISIASFAWTWYFGRRSERRSYRDSFWFREILAPSCIDPVRDLREVWCEKILKLVGTKFDGPELRQLVGEIQADTTKIIRSMWVSRIFAGGFYQSATEALEGIEDAITDVIYRYVKGTGPLDQAGADQMIDALTERCLQVLHHAATLHASSMMIKNIEAHAGCEPSWRYRTARFLRLIE